MLGKQKYNSTIKGKEKRKMKNKYMDGWVHDPSLEMCLQGRTHYRLMQITIL